MSKAYYLTEKHYGDAWGGRRPGNNGGINMYSRDRTGTVDIEGALNDNADVECKLRSNLPDYLAAWMKAISVKTADSSACGIVLMTPKSFAQEGQETFVLIPRSDFDACFADRVRAGKVTDSAHTRVDGMVYIDTYTRKIPKTFVKWTAKIRALTTLLPIIALHPKGKRHLKSDVIIIPAVEFCDFFGDQVLHSGLLASVVE